MLAAASAAVWPADVPTPDQTITDRNHAAARDFAYIAGAYVLLHELGHNRIAASGCTIAYDQDLSF